MYQMEDNSYNVHLYVKTWLFYILQSLISAAL